MTIKSIKTGWTGISAAAGNLQLGDFESIATYAVTSGSTSSVTFSAIPQNFQHLQLRIFAQISNVSTASATMRMKINTSTSSNRTHQLYANGSSGGAYTGTTTGDVGWLPYSGNTSIFGVSVIDIINYASTNYAKTARVLTGFDKNGSGGEIVLASVLYTGTTAISSITLETPGTGEPFTQYSHFALYGIR